MRSAQPTMRPVSNYCDGRDNNFNLIRCVAALAVLFSHSFSVVFGFDDPYRPLLASTGLSLGSHAVNIFFVVSGLLIMQSWDRSSSPLSFVTARVLRIYPAILVYTILIVFVFGAALSDLTLGSYFASAETWKYLFSVGSLLEPDRTLPGLFQENPDAINVNASLWTIRYEILCYMVLVIAGLMGVFKTKKRFTLVALVALTGLLSFSQTSMAGDSQAPYGSIVRFGLCFGIGVAIYHYRDTVRLHWSWLAVSGLLAYLSHGTILGTVTLYVSVAYWVLWFAYIPNGSIRSFNKAGDYSYGIYIFAYPIQQAFVATIPGLSPIQVFLLAGSATLTTAILSWHLVEQPSLKAKSSLTHLVSKKLGWRSRQDSNLQHPA
ncbi:MAG TPA: hypothetical protein DD437_00655 [Rhodobiaceae bacterium]|nr:hypothetical protein [Rhodobiaceae bacterium]|tara:strand:- start:6 stop:1136 length:1131 start_codon:yes stop_codon:yes gene_type:complete